MNYLKIEEDFLKQQFRDTSFLMESNALMVKHSLKFGNVPVERIRYFFERFFGQNKGLPTKNQVMAVIEHTLNSDQDKKVFEEIIDYIYDNQPLLGTKNEFFEWVRHEVAKKAFLTTGMEYIDKQSDAKLDEFLKTMSELHIIGNQASQVVDMNDSASATQFETFDFLPTGFKSLDDEMCGFVPGSLNTIAGTTNSGKSALLINIADNLAKQGKNCLYIHYEMAMSEIVIRFTQIRLNETFNSIQKMRRENNKKLAGSLDAVRRKGSCFILDASSLGMTVLECKGVINKLEEKGAEIDVVLLDYCDIAYVRDRKPNTQWEKEDIIIENLKSLSEGKRVMIMATQLKKGIVIENIHNYDWIGAVGGSKRKTFDASSVICLHQDELQKQNGELTVVIAKAKYGKAGTVLNWKTDFAKMKFYDGMEDPIQNLELAIDKKESIEKDLKEFEDSLMKEAG